LLCFVPGGKLPGADLPFIVRQGQIKDPFSKLLRIELKRCDTNSFPSRKIAGILSPRKIGTKGKRADLKLGPTQSPKKIGKGGPSLEVVEVKGTKRFKVDDSSANIFVRNESPKSNIGENCTNILNMNVLRKIKIEKSCPDIITIDDDDPRSIVSNGLNLNLRATTKDGEGVLRKTPMIVLEKYPYDILKNGPKIVLEKYPCNILKKTARIVLKRCDDFARAPPRVRVCSSKLKSNSDKMKCNVLLKKCTLPT